ncbi:MAG: NitT/TauT family transport system permease protein [Moorella sp. (in: firmicutes)]|uniref:Uncharacterized protein n=1 Tax=Neomoorella thermoacetica TaxID=1525 RepID=A0A1J5NQB5_NEOTH|nr:NitT/TauT family transport system permease protein [Moorella sp. (in: firmicutes)]OIQ60878.1 hypothetical protein MOTE_04050 [Moorella thermoacetica]
MKKILATLNDRLLSTYGVIAFFLLWEMAPRLGWADAQFIPPLSRVLLAIWKLAITASLPTVSMKRSFSLTGLP